MKAKEVLKILRITRATLCRYVKLGLISVKENPNGFYDYSDDDVLKLAGVQPERKCAIYARVSTQKQKKDLSNQIEIVREYANKNGYCVDRVYSDIASGLSYDRGEFKEMLNDVLQYKLKTVFVSNKDRLTRVSFDMWRELFKMFSCELIVINEDEATSETGEKEIFEDIISLLHCFAMRMYSSRRKKKIQLVEEDLTNEISL